MSGIFGAFNLDGRPVEEQCLLKMQKAMHYWGPDGSSIWSQHSVGLGHLMLFNTPESVTESLPLQNSTGHLSLTCGARLDNRDDLFRELRVPVHERGDMADSTIILMAYEKWGVECPNHLLGDWAFAVWDARKQQLFIARDHFGVSGLYYYQDNQTFLFASSLKGLLAVDDISYSLNPVGLAHRFPKIPRNDTTCYNDIFRLTPGHSITIRSEKTNLHQYWHPDQVPDVRFQTDEQYLEAFLEIFTEAVNCRLRSYRPVGSLLSGGLDSGSIATLAANSLAQNNQQLSTFSSIPLHDTASTVSDAQFGDESPLIQEICKAAGNIDAHYINANNITPMTGIKRILDIFEQPELGAANMYWLVALLEKIQRQGIGTVLHGDMGNFTISWAGNRDQYLLALLKQGRGLSFINELKAWQQFNHSSMHRAIKSQLIKPLMPHVAKSYLRMLGFSNRFDILNNHFVETIVRPHEESLEKSNNLKYVASPHREIYASYKSGLNTTPFELGAAFGLEIRSPAIDKRVLSFCLGIPQNQYTRDGQERLLIRRAMSGKMPQRVLWNKRRGRQAADISQRVLASKLEIDTLLKTLKQSNFAGQYLNLEYLTRIFDGLSNESEPTPGSAQKSGLLLRGLNIGLFLQHFENRSA
jgi:asparagine synthase (glutamine-hydrolysing)